MTQEDKGQEAVPPEIEAEQIEQPREPEAVPLFDDDCLNQVQVRRVSDARLTRVIVLAGEPGSGKTTLLVSIFQKYCEGPFAGYSFSGSMTLRGWERRCYLSRTISEALRPETERTLDGECVFLHLRVRKSDLCQPAQDLLFTDISGETFRQIRDSTEVCKGFGVLGRADHFCLTLDGEKLSDPGMRQAVFHSCAQMLRSCLDAEMLGKKSFVDILFTKFDKCAQGDVPQFVAHVRRELDRRFAARVARLRFFEVAARPTSDSGLPFAHGIEPLFPSWVEDSPLVLKREMNLQEGILSREFEKYLRRRLSPEALRGE